MKIKTSPGPDAEYPWQHYTLVNMELVNLQTIFQRKEKKQKKNHLIEIYLIKVIEIHSILSSLGTKTKSYYLNSLCSADKINTSTELHTHKHLTLRWRAGPRNRLPLLCIHPGDQTNCIKCQVHPRAAVFQMYILHPRAVWKKLCAAGCLYLLSCEFSELYKYMCVCECV